MQVQRVVCKGGRFCRTSCERRHESFCILLASRFKVSNFTKLPFPFMFPRHQLFVHENAANELVKFCFRSAVVNKFHAILSVNLVICSNLLQYANQFCFQVNNQILTSSVCTSQRKNIIQFSFKLIKVPRYQLIWMTPTHKFMF